MGNVLSIMLSYRMYKDAVKLKCCCKKKENNYGDFLKDCEHLLETGKLKSYQIKEE